MCQKPDREGGPVAGDALPGGQASDMVTQYVRRS